MRKVLIFAVVAAIAVVAVMFVTKKGDKPQQVPAKKVQQEQVAKPAIKKDKLKVGFVYISPVGDEGYSYAQDQGRLAIDKLPYVETSFVESVPEGPDSERVILNFARKDFDIIFGTSFGYMDPMVKISKEFPKTTFMHCSGFKKTPNMNNYFGRMYQARYLTGIVAGMMTKSNVIGYVAAFPIPEVIRGINAFTLGVRSVNPEATVRVVWTKTWYDPALEKDAAISLLDVKADVITQHQDSPGPQEAAQERGKYSIAYNSDMSKMAPKSHLTAAVWNWAPLFKNTVEQVRDGVWKGNESLWWGMDQGVVDIAPFGPMVPQNVKDKVAAAKAEIIAGNNAIFVGPIKDQNGKEIVPAGKTMADGDMLGMMWFVEGVIGNTK